jgi:hypothetical protein
MKMNCLRRYSLVVAALLVANEARAEITNATVVAQATIRDGANANVDLDEVTLGYVMVKYGTGSAAKGYFLFNLAGMNPNTNVAATFRINQFSNSDKMHVQLWGLNQAYPNFDSHLTWNTAQANDTNSNSMLTNGLYTATSIMDAAVPKGAAFDFALPGGANGWGKFLISNQLVLALATVNDTANNSSSGLRIQATNTDFLSTLTFSTTAGDLPPLISGISNQTVVAHHATGFIPFTIGDKEDSADLLTVYATSSNESVVPAALCEFGGTGSNRTINVTAGNQPGSAVVTVHVTDSAGGENQTMFTVTVSPDPAISPVPHVHTLVNTPTQPIAFTVGAVDTPVAQLTVTGVSGNANLVLDSGITTSGTGTNRTVTVTPVTDQTGVAPITLTVSDGINTTTTSFTVMVLPLGNTVFLDQFDYADGNLNPLSFDFWALRISGSVKLQVSGQQAVIRSSTVGDSLLAPLAGGPYAVGNHTVLYTSMKATWTVLAADSVGAFAHLWDGNGNFLASVRTLTNNAADGFFRLGIANNANPTEFPMDLTINVPYTIVTRYDIDSAITTLWVDLVGNPLSEASNSVVAVDIQNPFPVSQIGLRQNSRMGTIQIDDLKVMAITTPTIVNTVVAAGSIQIDFSAGPQDAVSDFGVMGASQVIGPFDHVNAAIIAIAPGLFRATLPMSGSQGYYRVKRLPMKFP